MRKNKKSVNYDQRNRNLNPYIIFGAIGLVFLAMSFGFYSYSWDIWGQVFLNLGASVSVVIVIEFVWRRFGGDPIIKAIDSLWRATNLLRELEKSGINSIVSKRSDLDSQEQRELWRNLLNSATHVDLMAWSMRSQIARHPDIMKAIEDAIRLNRCKVRVLTFPPFKEISECTPLLLQRINEEKRLPGGEAAVKRVQGNLTDTWSQFTEMKNKLEDNPECKNCLEIKAADKIMIYSNIIRIDDRMWVSPYSASERGGGNPVFEIVGLHSMLFQRYLNEFNHMWDPPQPREEKTG